MTKTMERQNRSKSAAQSGEQAQRGRKTEELCESKKYKMMNSELQKQNMEDLCDCQNNRMGKQRGVRR